MTITHPQHPLHGQQVEIIRIRRGIVPDLIVRLPDGLHVALAVDWTDYAMHAVEPSSPAPPVLAIDGVRQLAQLIARLQQEGAAAAPSDGTC